MLACVRPDLEELSVYHLAVIPSDLCKLDANESPWDLPITFKKKLAQIVSEDILAHRYPDGIYHELKGAIGEYVGVSTDRIALGNGSDELIRSLLLVSALGRGSILVAEPTFSMYGILAQSLGIKVVRAQRDHQWQIDLDYAQALIAQEPIAIVFVVNPNSPTGNILTRAEIEWLEALPSSTLVVIDEAYFEYANYSLLPYLTHHPNWVILRTFSKAFRLAAYRVGYCIGDPQLIACLEKVRLPYNLPTISARTAHLALMHRGELLGTIPEMIAVREEFYEFVKSLGWQVWPSWANFVYCQTDEDAEMFVELQQLGILIRHTGGGLRITIGTAEEMDKCKKAILACRKFKTCSSA